MNISEFKIETMEGGLASGRFALTLVLSTGGFKVSPGPLAEAILRQLTPLPASPVLITGDVASEENLDVVDLIQALYANRVTPILEFPGPEKPDWAALVQTRVARITEEPWDEIPVSEIIYTMTQAGGFPRLGLPAYPATSFILDPRSFISGEDIMRFVKASPWPWRIASQPRVRLHVDLRKILRVLEAGSNPSKEPQA